MAEAPAIANVKNAEAKHAAMRTGKAAAGTKRSKDDNSEATFEKALKRAGEGGRSETRDVDGSLKTAGSGRKLRHRDADLRKKAAFGESARSSPEEHPFPKTESVRGDIGKRITGKMERPKAANNKTTAVEGKAESVAPKIAFGDDLLTDFTGSTLASESREKRGRSGNADSRSTEVRHGGGEAKPHIGPGKISTEVLEHKVPRIIIEDRRVSGGKMRPDDGRAIRLGAKGGERSAPGEPVTFRLEGGAANGGPNSFAMSETDIDLSSRGTERSAIENASAELSRKLDAQAGNEIVRQVKVVLTRANAGEVRINLRPENLGRVRVRIQMEDNRLTGRIFVESAAAREAFRGALDGLQAKLVESGFGSADLELAWDEGQSDLSQFDRKKGRGSKNRGDASREFEGMSATVEQEDVRIGDGRVDMVV